jgi:hypothetical protein
MGMSLAARFSCVRPVERDFRDDNNDDEPVALVVEDEACDDEDDAGNEEVPGIGWRFLAFDLALVVPAFSASMLSPCRARTVSSLSGSGRADVEGRRRLGSEAAGGSDGTVDRPHVGSVIPPPLSVWCWYHSGS